MRFEVVVAVIGARMELATMAPNCKSDWLLSSSVRDTTTRSPESSGLIIPIKTERAKKDSLSATALLTTVWSSFGKFFAKTFAPSSEPDCTTMRAVAFLVSKPREIHRTPSSNHSADPPPSASGNSGWISRNVLVT